MTLDLEIVHAWLEASKDLNIRVVAPCKLDLSDGKLVQFEARVVDFGSANGAIVMSDVSRSSDLVQNLGLWSSVVSDYYRVYRRQLFIETLDDWGWYGEPSRVPAWYSGKPWGK